MSNETHVLAMLYRLKQRLQQLSPLGIAVSGGVDSMTLACIAHQVDPDCAMFHALSPAVPASATDRVQAYAAKQGWRLRLIDAGEMRDPDYLRNPANRCYFCKSSLYRTIRRHTAGTIASGTNTDDLDDYRPGLQAAGEYAIVHPLVEAGIDKAGVRALARQLGLSDLQELPASPCLSSRVTTGLPIDAALLPLIDAVEFRIRALMAAEEVPAAVRCRIRRDHVAVQLDTSGVMDESFQYAKAIRQAVREVFDAGGYPGLSSRIEIEPYRRGSAFIRVVNDAG